MDTSLFKPKAWEQFLLTGQLFDESNSFIFESDGALPPDTDTLVDKPIFIVGCGRSGTTLIGNMLNKHANVLFLNEPRSIWLSIFPELDVWSVKALFSFNNTLCPDIDPANHSNINHKTKQLQIFYCKLLKKYNKKIIVDKLPTHSFRINLLRTMWPHCKIIHIKRNGYNVSESISKFTLNAWYGINGNIKWNALKSFIIKNKLIQNFQSMIEEKKQLNMNEMGLIEWTASILSIKKDINHDTDDNYLEIRYEDITNCNKHKSYQTVKSLFQFIDPIHSFIDNNHSLICSAMDIIKMKKKDIINQCYDCDNIIFEETRSLLTQFEYESIKSVESVQIICICLNDIDNHNDYNNTNYLLNTCNKLLESYNNLMIIAYGNCICMACDIIMQITQLKFAKITKIQTDVEMIGFYKAQTKIICKLCKVFDSVC